MQVSFSEYYLRLSVSLSLSLFLYLFLSLSLPLFTSISLSLSLILSSQCHSSSDVWSLIIKDGFSEKSQIYQLCACRAGRRPAHSVRSTAMAHGEVREVAQGPLMLRRSTVDTIANEINNVSSGGTILKLMAKISTWKSRFYLRRFVKRTKHLDYVCIS